MNTLPKSERILIVGGTSGIGAAVAERLSARYAITITSRRLMKYPHFDQLAFDASDPGSIRAALGDSIFDHVVVTAADTPTGPLKDLSDISVHRAIQNKLVLSYMVLREIRAVRSVTLTSGYLSARPGKATALQSALNSSIESLTRAAAVELSPVRVNCVSPGTVNSSMWDRLPEHQRRKVLEDAAARSLLGRVAETGDIARAFEFAIECSYMTGETVFVDGGARFS